MTSRVPAVCGDFHADDVSVVAPFIYKHRVQRSVSK